MTPEFLDIIIPVYNEGANIHSVIAALKHKVRIPFRILICYDMEEDTTLAAIARLSPGECDILLVKNPERGPHGAVRAGFAASKAPAVLVYMADDDYNTGIIDDMVAKFRGGCDIVAASRFMPGGSMENCSSKTKETITRVAAFVLYRIARVGVHDPTNAFRLFSRRVIETIEIESRHGFTFSIELLVKARRLGWKVDQVPARWIERMDKPSRFKLLPWLPRYFRWLLYALATAYLGLGPRTVRRRTNASAQ